MSSGVWPKTERDPPSVPGNRDNGHVPLMGVFYSTSWCQEGADERQAPSEDVNARDARHVTVHIVEPLDGHGQAKESKESSTSLSTSLKDLRTDSKARRSLLLKTAFSVEEDLMRGISLRESLRHAGRLWRVSPSELEEKDKAALKLFSAPVKGFDMFLSHTWHTRGRWKYLSLSFHYGWVHVLLGWFISMLILELLFFFDFLPALWSSKAGVCISADGFPCITCISKHRGTLFSFPRIPYRDPQQGYPGTPIFGNPHHIAVRLT